MILSRKSILKGQHEHEYESLNDAKVPRQKCIQTTAPIAKQRISKC